MLCIFSYIVCFFFFKQKTSYDMRISDWSSVVCSSDLEGLAIVADLLDDVVGPLLVQSKTLAHFAGHAQDALDVRVGAFGHFIDVLGRDAVLFGFQHGDRKSVV